MWTVVLVVVAAAFLVGAGYVVASSGPVRPLAVHLAGWCLALGVVLWIVGLGWDAVFVPVAIAALFALVFLPAGLFTSLRAWREERELRSLR